MTASHLRPPAVAGFFYPEGREELAALVDSLLAGASARLRDLPAVKAPKVLVAPHAGYRYSGPVAASAYASLRAGGDHVRHVVLVGPPHRKALRGLATCSWSAFETPLGAVPIDHDLRATALAGRRVVLDDAAHGPEHCLEVQLPFLQRTLPPGFTILPLLAGGATPSQVADALEPVWGGEETLVVVSTDLSHYLGLGEARRRDEVTASAVTSRAWEDIGADDACGAVPLRGVLEVARRKGLEVALLDLRSSGDTAGPPDRVVGYGAFAMAGGG